MKTNQPQTFWTVRSITNSDGRRAITLWRNPTLEAAQHPPVSNPTSVQPQPGLKLILELASEDLRALELFIRIRRPAKRRVSLPHKLQLLNGR